jgi:hypothetical protein
MATPEKDFQDKLDLLAKESLNQKAQIIKLQKAVTSLTLVVQNVNRRLRVLRGAVK